MEKIGMFDAKTRFAEIVRQVRETGRAVLITNRGEEMVEIVPANTGAAGRRTPQKAFEELVQLRRRLPKSSKEQIHRDMENGRL